MYKVTVKKTIYVEAETEEEAVEQYEEDEEVYSEEEVVSVENAGDHMCF